MSIMKTTTYWALTLTALLLTPISTSCASPAKEPASTQPTSHQHASNPSAQGAPLDPHGRSSSVAIFAGGCFWCMESRLEPLKGVSAVISGYTGGLMARPSYSVVSAGQSDHVEAVWVEFDPKEISYTELLEAFWRSIDPTQRDGQFADRGPQYLTAIFYLDEAQQSAAQRSRDALSASGTFKAAIFTPLRKASLFWPAEAYHQDYYRKNPSHYKRYYEGSGRGPFIRRVWGK